MRRRLAAPAHQPVRKSPPAGGFPAAAPAAAAARTCGPRGERDWTGPRRAKEGCPRGGRRLAKRAEERTRARRLASSSSSSSSTGDASGTKGRSVSSRQALGDQLKSCADDWPAPRRRRMREPLARARRFSSASAAGAAPSRRRAAEGSRGRAFERPLQPLARRPRRRRPGDGCGSGGGGERARRPSQERCVDARAAGRAAVATIVFPQRSARARREKAASSKRRAPAAEPGPNSADRRAVAKKRHDTLSARGRLRDRARVCDRLGPRRTRTRSGGGSPPRARRRADAGGSSRRTRRRRPTRFSPLRATHRAPPKTKRGGQGRLVKQGGTRAENRREQEAPPPRAVLGAASRAAPEVRRPPPRAGGLRRRTPAALSLKEAARRAAARSAPAFTRPGAMRAADRAGVGSSEALPSRRGGAAERRPRRRPSYVSSPRRRRRRRRRKQTSEPGRAPPRERRDAAECRGGPGAEASALGTALSSPCRASSARARTRTHRRGRASPGQAPHKGGDVASSLRARGRNRARGASARAGAVASRKEALDVNHRPARAPPGAFDGITRRRFWRRPAGASPASSPARQKWSRATTPAPVAHSQDGVGAPAAARALEADLGDAGDGVVALGHRPARARARVHTLYLRSSPPETSRRRPRTSPPFHDTARRARTCW